MAKQPTSAPATQGRDWSDTLFLPKTDFPMRAGLPAMEPKLIERWRRIGLYGKLRAQSKGRARFTLHDGPPYANAHIHIGHALNKILKDLVTRSQQMLGHDSNYVPGWDCHGLPIEWEIEKQYASKGKAKPNMKDPAAMKAFRAECRAFAEHWMKVQSEEFQRLGVEGDWEHPYTTMTFPAEAQIARELMKFAETGQLYRGSKPVMWSVVEQTALAEAEIEYQDYTSDQVWVKFPLSSPSPSPLPAENAGRGETFVVIWTTTPWTIPGNRAICFNSKLEYGLYEVTKAPDGNWAKVGEKYVLADKLADDVMKAAKVEAFVKRQAVDFARLGEVVCHHPLRNAPLPSGEGSGVGRGGTTGASSPGGFAQSSTPPQTPPQRGGGSGETGAKAYGFPVPLLDGDHVTDDAGTGFVHTAPGHGREDFDIWTASTRHLQAMGVDTAIPYTVDEHGAFTREAPGFEGRRVLTDKGDKGDANEAVIKALAAAGMMVARGRLRHQYPHSWRSKKPVIFRNTPQWFIHMDKAIPYIERVAARPPLSPSLRGEGRGEGQRQSPSEQAAAPHPSPHPARGERGPGVGHNQPSPRTLREASLQSIRETEWVPASGENRIRGMIEAKPDWVVSRQRAWGVPITVFVKKGTNDLLRDAEVDQRIYDALYAEGADAWFTDPDGARFLKGATKLAPAGYDPAQYEKVNDVLDVWFDSGSTHTYVLEDATHFPGLAGFKRIVDGGRDRVMYLEGSDQHRGWFHSSLIESSGTRGRAPFDVVLTHGFTMDEKGQKMSKSVGNVVSPQEVMKTYGADILRLWVAASDYADDQRLGPEILKGFAETYRKIRNTLRWMLGTLAHYEPAPSDAHSASGAAMPELERLMLHRLAELSPQVRDAYAGYDYARVVMLLSQLLNSDLSAFYFDIRKDALYCEPYSSAKRRAALSCVEQLFRHVTVWLAPILAFTAEEAWLQRYPSEAGSVHLELFPDLPASWRNDALAAKWERIRQVRSVITGALEIERAAKRVGASLEAAPEVWIDDPALAAALKGVDLAEVAITSAATVKPGAAPAGAFTLPEVPGVGVVVKRAEGRKCARSWRIVGDVGANPAYPELSARDAEAVIEHDRRAGRSANA